MERPLPDIKFTLGFCLAPAEEKILMLYRNNSPNKKKWNGLGGKINYAENETHQECIIRELMEETDGLIDLTKADELKYAGVVTWDVTRGDEQYVGGMHTYIAKFSDQNVIFGRKDTREGILDWLPLADVVNPDNADVVENISRFLEAMLHSTEPARYHCIYVNDVLEDFQIFPLTLE